MSKSNFEMVVHASSSETVLQKELVGLLKNSPVDEAELLANLGLYLTSKNLARILFFYEIYKKVAPLHGVVMEFGTRWGQSITVLSALRGIFEPFNRIRKMVAFDTFQGLKGVNEKDAGANDCSDGSYSVPESYQIYLEKRLTVQEGLNPMGHKKKFEVVAGDVVQTLPDYLARHPETMVSLAVFDMDIYAPTAFALKMIEPYLFKGSILVFDELCDEVFPGETVALRESLNMKNLRIERLPITSRLSYAIYE